MPYLVNLQKPEQSTSQDALYLPKQAQWPSESEKLRDIVTNWPGFTVAILEPLKTTQIWENPGASTVRVPQTQIRLLDRLYTFRERTEVLWFLERYPFLPPLLLEAYDEIENHFPYSELFLEVVTDPEETDDSQLVISIGTNLNPDEADDRLDEFDDSWWLDALDQAQGKLCIDVEFR